MEQIISNDEQIISNDEQIILNDEQIISNDEQIILNDEQIISNDEQIISNNEQVLVSINLLKIIDTLTDTLNDYKNKYNSLFTENTINITKIEEYIEIIKIKDDEILKLHEKINSSNKIDLLIKLRENLINKNIEIQNDIEIQNEIKIENNNDIVENIVENVVENQNITKINLPRKRAIPFRRF